MTAGHCAINIARIAAGGGERSFPSSFPRAPSCAASRSTALVCVSAMLSAAAGDSREAEVLSRQASAKQLPVKQRWETSSFKTEKHLC